MPTRFEWANVSSITGLPYEVGICEDGLEETLPCGSIRFQHDVAPEEEINGTTLEAIITLCQARLQMFQDNPVTKCAENADAIISLQRALIALDQRRQRRIEQGVYGQFVPHTS